MLTLRSRSDDYVSRAKRDRALTISNVEDARDQRVDITLESFDFQIVRWAETLLKINERDRCLAQTSITHKPLDPQASRWIDVLLKADRLGPHLPRLEP